MFDDQQFQELSNYCSTDSPCVSIFIPTHRANNLEKDRIRFKNALQEAEKKLQAKNLHDGEPMSEREAEGFLSKAHDLLDNQDFWQHQSDGLAVFISKDKFETFSVPVSFEPLTYVKTHFYLRPLMPMLNGEDLFYLLALSQGEIRFFEGRAHSITAIKIADLVPTSMEEAMALEDPEKSLQHHDGGGQTGIYHGQGGRKDQKDWQMEDYCRRVDKGINDILCDEKAPLILVGTEEIVGVYRQVSDYKNILEDYVSISPDDLSPPELHERAWPTLQDYFRQDLDAKKESFSGNLAAEKAAFSLTDIVPKAINGRVETLFLDRNAPVVWGSFDPDTNKAVLHDEEQPGSVCLHDLVARKTYEQGGQVFSLERTAMPRPTAEVNATYRY